MRPSKMAALVSALLLVACSATQRPMPNLEDETELTAAVESLSPWQDGSPDRSNDGRTRPELGSERALFVNWVLRYVNHERYRQHDRDYEPMAVPATIGAAIDEERGYEDEQRAQRAREDAEAERQRAAEKAEQDRLYREQQAAADEKARVEGEEAAADAAIRERQEADAAAASKVDYDCRQQREQAEYTASLHGSDIQGKIAKIRATVRCPSDAP